MEANLSNKGLDNYDVNLGVWESCQDIVPNRAEHELGYV